MLLQGLHFRHEPFVLAAPARLLRHCVRLRCGLRARFGQLFAGRYLTARQDIRAAIGYRNRNRLATLRMHALIGSAETVPLAQPRQDQRRTAPSRRASASCQKSDCKRMANKGLSPSRCNQMPRLAAERILAPVKMFVSPRGVLESHISSQTCVNFAHRFRHGRHTKGFRTSGT
jgi:hypothetical protein